MSTFDNKPPFSVIKTFAVAQNFWLKDTEKKLTHIFKSKKNFFAPLLNDVHIFKKDKNKNDRQCDE